MDSEAAPANPADKLILIVDDDESFLNLMEIVVQKAGFRTERALNGKDALSKVQGLQPHLLILDMMLPGMGGYEILRELQSVGAGHIPIIMVTGRNMDRDGADLLSREPNVREFMSKPIRTITLVASIHRILNTQPNTGARGQQRS